MYSHLQAAIQRLCACLHHPLLRNLGWLSSAQLINRILRLAATVIIARTLLPEEYGLVAIIFTVHEVVTAIIRRSTQTHIVNTDVTRLDSVCLQAYRLNWLVCATASLFQLVLAVGVVIVYQNLSLLAPLAVLAVIHLLLPFAMVQAGLNIRRNAMHVIAKIDVVQTLAEALLTILLLLLGAGIWALILAKVAVVPIWIKVHRTHCHWHPTAKPTLPDFTVMNNSLLVIASDAVSVLKHNLDYLLIGYVWGAETLGIYYFAYNAGVGVSAALSQAAGAALFPHLCQQPSDRQHVLQEFTFAVKAVLVITTAVCFSQVFLAEWYVPLVFGARWVELGAIPILILLCLSTVPRAISEVFSQLLRAKGLLRLDLTLNCCLTLLLALGICWAVPFGLATIAITLSTLYCVGALGLAAFAYQRLFGRASSTLWLRPTVSLNHD